jgi:predicted anti-sigma-YlaC factor YlaD
MLSCRQMTELVTDYLEGRLSTIDRIRFQLHIGICRHCRDYLDQMRITVRTLGAMPSAPVPDHVMDQLLHRFRDWT